MKALKKVDPIKLRAQIDKLQRDPFKEILVTLLGTLPKPEALEKLANTSPQQFMQTLMIVSKLAGYADVRQGPQINILNDLSGQTNVLVQNLSKMSDSQLEGRFKKLMGVEKILEPNLVEGSR